MTARGSRLFASAAGKAALAIVVLGVAAFDLRYHEFWRDEAGAMMEARAVPWSRFLDAMHVEGIPPLFHVLLKLAGAVLPNPIALTAVGALGLSTLLFGTYRLVTAISRSQNAAWITLALSLTYVYAYELGVVVRQYALGLGLALLCFANLREALATGARRKAWVGAIAGGLSALTSAHSACVAGAGLLSFGLLSITKWRRVRAGWPILLTLPCFALVVYLAMPFPGRTASANVVYQFPHDITLRLGLQALVEGVMPSDWWFADSFLPRWLARAIATLRSVSFWGLLGGIGIALAARAGALRRRWRVEAFDLLAVVSSWPPLLVIIINHYWGFYRHHLFLGAPLVVILFGWALAARPVGTITAAARVMGLVLLMPWLLLQYALSAADLTLDARFPFSDTKSAAEALPNGAHVVAIVEVGGAGMMFWRPDLVMRSESWRGRAYRYISPDADWFVRVPLWPIIEEECRAAPESVYVAGAKASLVNYPSCTQPIAYPKSTLVDHPFTWESFDLFHIDCGCVANAFASLPHGAVPPPASP